MGTKYVDLCFSQSVHLRRGTHQPGTRLQDDYPVDANQSLSSVTSVPASRLINAVGMVRMEAMEATLCMGSARLPLIRLIQLLLPLDVLPVHSKDWEDRPSIHPFSDKLIAQDPFTLERATGYMCSYYGFAFPTYSALASTTFWGVGVVLFIMGSYILVPWIKGPSLQ